jgi:secreted trypsin-like serine protease
MSSLQGVKRWRIPGRRLAASAAILGVAAVALPGPAAGQAAPVAQASIIRGSVASIEDFPSLAFILARHSKNEGFACTGTVIAPRVVLTAGHCVQDLNLGGFTPPAEYEIATGRANPRQDGSGEVLKVEATHVFPGFNPGNTHGDAALLILATATTAPPIPLATAADGALYGGGTPVTLAGWGLTHFGAKAAPESLRSTSTVVLDPAACKRQTRSFYPPYSSAVELCTTDPPDRLNGGCFGDSGGPAIAHRADGSAVEIGVTSTGGPGCSTKLPNIFTRTDVLSTWAAEWIAATEAGGPPPALRAHLPGLTRESAQGLVFGLLSTRFGELFSGAQGLRGRCDRLGPARMKCELVWRFGPRIYYGGVTVFYALRQETVAWDNSYVIHRVRIRCLEGPNPKSCPVETRRG